MKKDPILKHDKKISETILYSGVRIRDNRRMLSPKTFLHIHNFGIFLEKRFRPSSEPLGPNDQLTGKFAKPVYWLKYKIGEAPILIDTFAVKNDLLRIRDVCFANGYFHPQVSYKIDTLKGLRGPKNKVKLTYHVREGTPYKIRNLDFKVLDSSHVVNRGLIEDTYEVLNVLKTPIMAPGDLYRHSDFGEMRAGLTNILRDQAFIYFTQDMVQFSVDTMLSENFSLPEEGPLTEKWMDVDIEVTQVPDRYIVKEIIVEIKDSQGIIPKEAYIPIRASRMDSVARDSLGIDRKRLGDDVDISFLVSPLALDRVNYNFLSERIHQLEGRHYYAREVHRTRQRLQELGMFKYVLVDVKAIEKEAAVLEITLQLASKYQVKAGAESFTRDVALNASIVPNIGANLSFRDKNAFQHSELFQLELSGSVGWNSLKLGQPDYYSLLAESKIQFHKFLFLKPFYFLLPKNIRGEGIRRLSPISVLSGSFLSENWDQITQFTPGLSLTYKWKNIPFKDTEITSVSPLSLEYIRPILSNVSGFDEVVGALPDILVRDFSRRISSKLQFSYTNQNYRKHRNGITHLYKVSGKIGGTLPYLVEQLALWQSLDEDPNDQMIRGVFYGQFAQLGLEGKWFVPTGRSSEVVVRGLLGAGSALNGTALSPKEGRFFAGGVNGMRGWQSNTLGPGRVRTLEDLGVNSDDLKGDSITSILGPGGELLLEVNAEFRFDVGSYLELALFSDVGNVWLTPGTKNDWAAEKAVLSPENFRLGWDAGIGFRLDFSFLILRLDFGQQIFAPDLDKGWVIRNTAVTNAGSRRQWNLGIDYPF